jgi:flagellar basal body-associated protein FliL
VIEEFCPQVVEDMNKKFNTNSEAVSLNTENKDESAVGTQSRGSSLVTITLIVVGVVLICAVGGGVIWVSVVKGRRDRPKTPEYSEIYVSIN